MSQEDLFVLFLYCLSCNLSLTCHGHISNLQLNSNFLINVNKKQLLIENLSSVIVPTGSEVEGMEAEVTQKVPEVLCEAAGHGDAAGTEQASLTDGESTSTQTAAVSNGEESDEGKEMVEVKIIWNKNKYDLKIPLDGTGAKLKEKIHTLTGNVTLLS